MSGVLSFCGVRSDQCEADGILSESSPSLMSNKKRPDPQTRFASHLLVGFVAGSVAGKDSGPGAFLVAALLSAFAHAALDAPVAQLLTDLGA